MCGCLQHRLGSAIQWTRQVEAQRSCSTVQKTPGSSQSHLANSAAQRTQTCHSLVRNSSPSLNTKGLPLVSLPFVVLLACQSFDIEQCQGTRFFQTSHQDNPSCLNHTRPPRRHMIADLSRLSLVIDIRLARSHNVAHHSAHDGVAGLHCVDP